MNKLITIMVLLVTFNPSYGQHDFDIFGFNATYKGKVKGVLVKYLNPIYEGDSIIKYNLDSSVPPLLKEEFDENGQLIKRQEFEATCGWELNCLIKKIEYAYENKRLKSKVQTGEFDKNETYTYSGDSILRNSIGKYKNTKTVFIEEKDRKIEKNSNFYTEQEIKITHLNDKKFPTKYERYWMGELTAIEEYFYKDTTNNLITGLTKINAKTGYKIQKEISYDENGNILVWQNFNNNGELYYQLTFEYKYDEIGNWVEMKVFNTTGNEFQKVIKKFDYILK